MTATEIKTRNKLTADEEAAPPQHLKVQDQLAANKNMHRVTI